MAHLNALDLDVLPAPYGWQVTAVGSGRGRRAKPSLHPGDVIVELHSEIPFSMSVEGQARIAAARRQELRVPTDLAALNAACGTEVRLVVRRGHPPRLLHVMIR